MFQPYLTESERATLVNALYTAADIYSQCAQDAPAAIVGAGAGYDTAQARIVDQFNSQAQEARALAEKLES